MNKTLHTFEVLIIDASGKAEITTVKSLIMALSYSEKLWKEAVVNSKDGDFFIEDKVLGITLQASKVPANQGIAFLTHITSTSEQLLDDFREKLLVHAIQKLDFTGSRILTDTISENISLSIFSKIKEVENSLRKYLDKALTQKVGVLWWDTIASETVRKNANDRSTLSNSYSGLVDNRISLTDSNDLSSLLAQTGIADSNFISKWEALNSLRIKVLTYGLFSEQDKSLADKTSQELLEWITNASNNVAQTSFKVVAPTSNVHSGTQEEKPEVKETKQETSKQEENSKPVYQATETVQPAATTVQVERTAVESKKAEEEPSKVSREMMDLITENALLDELRTAQNALNGKFVDLKSFVTKTLANKGYAFGPAYVVAKNMNEKGLVQIYDTKDEKGVLVKAIKVN